MLQTNDMFWVDHLEMMDYLRGSVNLRAYGQRDPLIEYKREGLQLFKEMEESVSQEILRAVSFVAPQPVISVTPNIIPVQTRTISPKGDVGRNDPCPCGSGKKWKKCGELNTEEHQKLMSQKK